MQYPPWLVLARDANINGMAASSRMAANDSSVSLSISISTITASTPPSINASITSPVERTAGPTIAPASAISDRHAEVSIRCCSTITSFLPRSARNTEPSSLCCIPARWTKRDRAATLPAAVRFCTQQPEFFTVPRCYPCGTMMFGGGWRHVENRNLHHAPVFLPRS